MWSRRQPCLSYRQIGYHSMLWPAFCRQGTSAGARGRNILSIRRSRARRQSRPSTHVDRLLRILGCPTAAR